jgi:hypothetical protein
MREEEWTTGRKEKKQPEIEENMQNRRRKG